MYKHLCDRCGREIERPQTNLLYYNIHYVRMRFFKPDKEVGGNPMNEREVDLCPECWDFFDRWLEGDTNHEH